MLLAFHKPYGVLSQFSKEHPDHRTLAEFGFPKEVYPIGRLDSDSEGLLLLSDEAKWNDLLLHPRHAHERTYHAQVEKVVNEEALAALRRGVKLKEFQTLPCKADLLRDDPAHSERVPPIRERKSIPTSWLELTLIEGKNRQVRRMTAAVGFPTLRLIRVAIGSLRLGDLGLEPGRWVKLKETQIQRILEAPGGRR